MTRTKRSSRLKLIILSLVAAIAVIVPLTVATPAQAYSRGCSFWNPLSVGGYSMSTGQYCAEVDGYSTWIYQVEGDFTSAGNVCNWDVTAEFFDSRWNWKRTFVSSHDYGCTRQGRKYISVPYYMNQLVGSNYGYMCSTLRVGWQRVTSVCHYIKP